jgi:hypothetical protein
MIVETLFTTSDIADASGFRLFADLLFGSNGSSSWAPELATGQQTESASYGSMVWDTNMDDGIDSGPVSVRFDANLATGSASLEAGPEGGDPVAYAGVSGGTIGSVVIRAGARVAGEVAWSELSITFWRGDEMAESVSLDATCVANPDDSSTGSELESISVTPTDTTYTRVSVTGSLQMRAADGMYPGWNDLFGQILIMPAA